jgi:hypothetical protein
MFLGRIVQWCILPTLSSSICSMMRVLRTHIDLSEFVGYGSALLVLIVVTQFLEVPRQVSTGELPLWFPSTFSLLSKSQCVGLLRQHLHFYGANSAVSAIGTRRMIG